MKFKKLSISLDTIDMEESWKFYQELGFQKSGEDLDNSGDPYWIKIKKDNTELMLYQAHDKKKLQEHAKTGFYNAVLYFEIEDVKSFYKELIGKGLKVEGLEATHYGATEFYLKDPNGHQLTFGTFY